MMYIKYLNAPTYFSIYAKFKPKYLQFTIQFDSQFKEANFDTRFDNYLCKGWQTRHQIRAMLACHLS